MWASVGHRSLREIVGTAWPECCPPPGLQLPWVCRAAPRRSLLEQAWIGSGAWECVRLACSVLEGLPHGCFRQEGPGGSEC